MKERGSSKKAKASPVPVPPCSMGSVENNFVSFSLERQNSFQEAHFELIVMYSAI